MPLESARTKRFPAKDLDVNVQLLTPAARGEYLERVQHDIASAEHFVLVTAFATSDGITLLERAMRKCLEAGVKVHWTGLGLRVQ